VSRRYRIGTRLFASLLAPAATNCGAVAEHLSYYTAWCSYARLVVRRRNVSGLVLVRGRLCACWRLDDFPKGKTAGASNSRGLITWVAISGWPALAQPTLVVPSSNLNKSAQPPGCLG